MATVGSIIRPNSNNVLVFFYKKATEEATRQSTNYKGYYDQKVREKKLEVGDKVFIQALGLKRKIKIADDWEKTPYTVLDVPIEDIPVYRAAAKMVRVVLGPCIETCSFHSHACHLNHCLVLC